MCSRDCHEMASSASEAVAVEVEDDEDDEDDDDQARWSNYCPQTSQSMMMRRCMSIKMERRQTVASWRQVSSRVPFLRKENCSQTSKSV